MFGHLKLRAINPARNVNRVYEIHVGQGLFNTITVILAYGRYGKGSHQRLSTSQCVHPQNPPKTPQRP